MTSADGACIPPSKTSNSSFTFSAMYDGSVWSRPERSRARTWRSCDTDRSTYMTLQATFSMATLSSAQSCDQVRFSSHGLMCLGPRRPVRAERDATGGRAQTVGNSGVGTGQAESSKRQVGSNAARTRSPRWRGTAVSGGRDGTRRAIRTKASVESGSGNGIGARGAEFSVSVGQVCGPATVQCVSSGSPISTEVGVEVRVPTSGRIRERETTGKKRRTLVCRGARGSPPSDLGGLVRRCFDASDGS
jgi:hypothetical protein